MNKELEEFKKEIIDDVTCLLRLADSAESCNTAKHLLYKLTLKPEFMEGETVLVSDDNENWMPSVFEYNYNNKNNNSVNYKFFCSGLRWKYCKKTEALPMNMTKYDGTNRPSNKKIVFVKRKSNSLYDFDGGKSEDIEWNGVEAYQILEDLNP